MILEISSQFLALIFLSENRSCLEYAGKFASLLEGMIGLPWGLVGLSPERQLPWGSNALFYLADLFSRVSPNKIMFKTNKFMTDSGKICPCVLHHITIIIFTFV